jgi:hypothetical protein
MQRFTAGLKYWQDKFVIITLFMFLVVFSIGVVRYKEWKDSNIKIAAGVGSNKGYHPEMLVMQAAPAVEN